MKCSPTLPASHAPASRALRVPASALDDVDEILRLHRARAAVVLREFVVPTLSRQLADPNLAALFLHRVHSRGLWPRPPPVRPAVFD